MVVVMEDLPLFKDISLNDINKMMTCFKAKKVKFKNEDIIFSNTVNSNEVGIILYGTASMIRYDYNGNRSIIESLEENSIFGKMFSYLDNEVSIIATSECEILLFNYELLMKRCKNNCTCHVKIMDNVLELLSSKIMSLNERVEVLSKRSIKDKLLCYFDLVVKRKGKKSFYLPLSYTELADYISVDRSAMMREIKNLKDDGIISSNGKKLTLMK